MVVVVVVRCSERWLESSEECGDQRAALAALAALAAAAAQSWLKSSQNNPLSRPPASMAGWQVAGDHQEVAGERGVVSEWQRRPRTSDQLTCWSQQIQWKLSELDLNWLSLQFPSKELWVMVADLWCPAVSLEWLVVRDVPRAPHSLRGVEAVGCDPRARHLPGPHWDGVSLSGVWGQSGPGHSPAWAQVERPQSQKQGNSIPLLRSQLADNFQLKNLNSLSLLAAPVCLRTFKQLRWRKAQSASQQIIFTSWLRLHQAVERMGACRPWELSEHTEKDIKVIRTNLPVPKLSLQSQSLIIAGTNLSLKWRSRLMISLQRLQVQVQVIELSSLLTGL